MRAGQPRRPQKAIDGHIHQTSPLIFVLWVECNLHCLGGASVSVEGDEVPLCSCCHAPDYNAINLRVIEVQDLLRFFSANEVLQLKLRNAHLLVVLAV